MVKVYNRIPREWLRERRIELGLKTREIAEKLGISYQHYNDIETGRRNPSEELAYTMAYQLEIEIENFFVNRAKFSGMKTDIKIDTCCYCLNESNLLIRRNDGDVLCPKCHEEHCEHLHQKTDKIQGCDETVTYCLDCGEGLA